MNKSLIFPEFSYCDLLHNAPPYDSPIEEQFAYHFDKYKHSEVTLYQQVQVNTVCGSYRLDFVAKRNKLVIGIECDGKDFHDSLRDLWRDSMILSTGEVDAIFRFRGRDLNFHINDCLFVLSESEPDIFSSRGKINLNHLSSSEAKGAEYKSKYITERALMLHYIKFDEGIGKEIETAIHVERRSKISEKGKVPFWEEYYLFAKNHGSGNLDEIIKAYKASKNF